MASFKAAIAALQEMRDTSVQTGLSQEEAVDIRQQIEDIIGLEDYYVIWQWLPHSARLCLWSSGE